MKQNGIFKVFVGTWVQSPRYSDPSKINVEITIPIHLNQEMWPLLHDYI